MMLAAASQRTGRFRFLDLRSRVSRQMLFWSLWVGFVSSLLLGFSEFYTDYHDTRERSERHLQVLGTFASDALAQSLWSFDQTQIQLQLQGFLHSGDVTSVRLLQMDGTTLQYGTLPPETDRLVHTQAIRWNDHGTLHELGTLVLYRDMRGLWSQLLPHAGFTFAGHSTIILLLMGITLAIYDRIVRRRLEGIADELNAIHSDDLRTAAALPGPGRRPADDELDELAQAVLQLKHTSGRALLDLDAKHASLSEALARLDQSHRLLQTIIDTVPIRVFWKDMALRYLGCNPLFAQDAGCTHPAEMIGRTDHEFGWHEQAEAYQADDRRVIESGVARIGFEEPQTTPDGQQIWLRTSKVPLRDAQGRIVGVLGIYDDLTAFKQLELQLKAHRDTLEERVTERTRELAVARDAAEAASRAKTAFLANMSHELRTPLNAIIGMNALALRSTSEPRLRHHLEKVETASRHLLGIISDILDLSKIEADRLVLEETEFRLRTLFGTLDDLFGAKAHAKGIGLQLDLPVELADLPLRGDPLRLQQVLINLSANALKFTDHGSITVRVQQSALTSTHRTLDFEIIDTGIGISQEDLPRLFSSFEQADNSTTRKYGGTGLGLAISRRLVRLMGGDVEVTSRVGQGSRFRFSVVLAHPAADHPDPLPSGRATTPDADELLRRLPCAAPILLVDDDPVNREVSLTLIELAGLRCDCAEEGGQAIEMARQQAYSLILMDVQMPLMNGLDATRAIRADSLNRETPIIAMTANVYTEDVQSCLAAGMNAHLGKPIEPSALYDTLLRWLTPAPIETQAA